TAARCARTSPSSRKSASTTGWALPRTGSGPWGASTIGASRPRTARKSARPSGGSASCMDSPRGRQSRVEQLASGLEKLLALLLLAAIALNFANVVGRYVFGRTITGADEMQTYAMVWIAFLGAGIVAWRGEHLRMDVLWRIFPPRVQGVLRVLEALLVIALGGFALVQSVRYVSSMLKLGAASPMAQIPMWMPH